MYRVFFAFAVVVGAAVLAGSGCTPKDGNKSADLVLEFTEIDLVPGGEKQVKLKTGKAETVDAPKDSGLTAKTDGANVTVSAAKDAREATHQLTVKGGKAKDAMLKVNIKKDGK